MMVVERAAMTVGKSAELTASPLAALMAVTMIASTDETMAGSKADMKDA